MAFDQEGHGQSEGEKGTVRNIEDWIDNLAEYINITKQKYPKNIPIFILGGSLGGLACINLATRYPEMAQGMILFAPAIGLTMWCTGFITKLAS